MGFTTIKKTIKQARNPFRPNQFISRKAKENSKQIKVCDLQPGDVFLTDEGKKATVSAIWKQDIGVIHVWIEGSETPIIYTPIGCELINGKLYRKELKKVTNVFRGTTNEWYHVDIGTEELVCTAEHPYFVEGKWVPACELAPGDKLTTSNGINATVKNIWVQELDEPETTYNIEVEGAHNYLVGEAGILVHNRCKLGERMNKQGLLKANEDAHHLYPKAFETEFERLGIMVDDVANGIPMDSALHRGANAFKYNQKWGEVIHGVKNASQAEVYMKQFMFEVYEIIL